VNKDFEIVFFGNFNKFEMTDDNTCITDVLSTGFKIKSCTVVCA